MHHGGKQVRWLSWNKLPSCTVYRHQVNHGVLCNALLCFRLRIVPTLKITWSSSAKMAATNDHATDGGEQRRYGGLPGNQYGAYGAVLSISQCVAWLFVKKVYSILCS